MYRVHGWLGRGNAWATNTPYSSCQQCFAFSYAQAGCKEVFAVTYAPLLHPRTRSIGPYKYFIFVVPPNPSPSNNQFGLYQYLLHVKPICSDEIDGSSDFAPSFWNARVYTVCTYNRQAEACTPRRRTTCENLL